MSSKLHENPPSPPFLFDIGRTHRTIIIYGSVAQSSQVNHHIAELGKEEISSKRVRGCDCRQALVLGYLARTMGSHRRNLSFPSLRSPSYYDSIYFSLALWHYYHIYRTVYGSLFPGSLARILEFKNSLVALSKDATETKKERIFLNSIRTYIEAIVRYCRSLLNPRYNYCLSVRKSYGSVLLYSSYQ